jgi:hypothetical protein
MKTLMVLLLLSIFASHSLAFAQDADSGQSSLGFGNKQDAAGGNVIRNGPVLDNAVGNANPNQGSGDSAKTNVGGEGLKGDLTNGGLKSDSSDGGLKGDMGGGK